MLTKIRIKNFRQIQDETIELSNAVVIVGPNNGGKTSALQAISLLGVAIRKWADERVGKKSKAVKRTGVAIGLDELLNIPVTEINQIWRNTTVREGYKNPAGKAAAKNVKIELHAHGITNNTVWRIGFAFDFGRDTLMYCRLATDSDTNAPYDFPEALLDERIGYLPAMSGLAIVEDKLEPGSIHRLIGQGKTADVLRNICYGIFENDPQGVWHDFKKLMQNLFKIELNEPRFNPVNGTVTLDYNEGAKKKMDLTSLGSGARQALLLFAYVLSARNTVFLLDEPDAHLEVIRQENIYDRLSDFAKRNDCQIIVASHAESVLKRAFTKDRVISSVLGRFRPVNDQRHLQKTLTKIGYEQILMAEQTRKILYLEGSTDLIFLKAFAAKYNRPALLELLDDHIVFKPVANSLSEATDHFKTLKEFIPDIKGLALFDNLRKNVADAQIPDLKIHMWRRNEIENYVPLPYALVEFFTATLGASLIPELNRQVEAETRPAARRDLNHPFWQTAKISDDYLDIICQNFLDAVGLPRGVMDKSKYYRLIEFARVEDIDTEVKTVLDMIEKTYDLT